MSEDIKKDGVEQLSDEDLGRYAIDIIHRMAVHHGLWFSEVIHQLGLERALEVIGEVKEQSVPLQMGRLLKVLDFPADPFASWSREQLLKFIDALAVNWLANDGIWFQAVETSRDMNDAKRCNDTCWTRFSPFEARSIKRLLGLPAQAGLEGLKQALKFRLYARINVQSIEEEPDAIVFRMNDCRVQSARRRRNLPDYPCKSAGLVEYRTFGEGIDSRIQCECIGCPPDEHPDEWFCAWRFRLGAE